MKHPRGIPAWAVFLMVGLLAGVGSLLVTSTWLKAIVHVSLYTSSTVLLARAFWASRVRQRQVMLPALLAGAVLYLLGNLGWWFYPLVTGRPLPAPSVVDALYFSAYAAVGVFLVLLGRRNRASDPTGALDALIIALGLLPAGYLALVDPISGLAKDIGPMEATFLAYPLAVGLLVSLGLWVAIVAARRSVPYFLLMGWLGCELLGDVIYGRTGATGTFSYGQPWQVLFVLSTACLGALALHPGLLSLAAPSTRPLARARTRLLVLGAALAAPSGTILYLELQDQDPSILLLLCIATTLVLIVLVCLRLSSLMTDLAENRRLLAELERLSTDLNHRVLHDPLTGLGNRTMLRDRLQLALAQRALAADRGAALLLLDLDDFKAVNDSLGHDAGDVVLGEVARRLAASARQGDTVCRLGGDEFAFVLSQASLQDALRLADRICLSLAEIMLVGAREIRPIASIGVSVGLSGQDHATLLAEADIAMYAAKSGPSRIAVFDPVLHREVLERHQFESDLREARARGELRVLYQPLVHLASNEMVAVEALVRWEHPTRGTVSPVDFIPLAELNGVILDLGDWVLQETCRQLAVWDAAYPLRRLGVSVNVSPRQLADPDFTGRATAIIGHCGVDPTRITLEVTEAALGTNTETMILRLLQLKELGVKLAIDDFGTGYSSLSHLRRLPVDVLKIDKSFVAGIARDPAEWALTTAIVQLAGSLRKSTLAEGIETGGQLAHLRSLNVEHGQGYLFSRPVGAHEIASLLNAAPGEAFLTA